MAPPGEDGAPALPAPLESTTELASATVRYSGGARPLTVVASHRLAETQAARGGDASRDSANGEGGSGGITHGTEGEGDDAAITVEPGQTGELTHTVDASEDLLIGCKEPDHYDVGVKMTIDLAQE
jgi:hypothetical protein